MSDPSTLHEEIKEILVDELMLDIEVDEIETDTPLMGPDSLGLDSVDALQLVVAIEKHYGLKITDPEEAKVALRSVATIATAVNTFKASQA
ncbi:acyl carrier protein [Luteolibacter sp. AS25]|uniref:acyl carrier protein n=1 Tax=Luteolibacter sp. AS25 TaxID=3135776 RepID=UPI00398B405D